MNEQLQALLDRVEAIVDAQPELTRIRPSGFPERAEFRFGEFGWCVHINVRNVHARGRGSRAFFDAMGAGDTPETAVASFTGRMPHIVQATR